MKYKSPTAALLLAVPYLYLLLLWPALPAQVPLHFDINGDIDRWGSRNEMVVTMAALSVVSLLLYILFSNLHRISKKAPAANKDRMQKMGLAVLAFMTSVQCWLLYIIQKGSLDGSLKFVLAAVFLLFAVLGNYMPNLKPNYFAGFRLPWTLHNETNWRKTHHLAGKTWFAGGLICTLLFLLLPFKIAIIVCGVLFIGMLLLPAVYSYRLFKQTKG